MNPATLGSLAPIYLKGNVVLAQNVSLPDKTISITYVDEIGSRLKSTQTGRTLKMDYTFRF